jgi:hypothetical protein
MDRRTKDGTKGTRPGAGPSVVVTVISLRHVVSPEAYLPYDRGSYLSQRESKKKFCGMLKYYAKVPWWIIAMLRTSLSVSLSSRAVIQHFLQALRYPRREAKVLEEGRKSGQYDGDTIFDRCFPFSALVKPSPNASGETCANHQSWVEHRPKSHSKPRPRPSPSPLPLSPQQTSRARLVREQRLRGSLGYRVVQTHTHPPPVSGRRGMKGLTRSRSGSFNRQIRACRLP